VALIMIACRFFGHCLFFKVDRLIETTYSKSGLLRVRQAPPLSGFICCSDCTGMNSKAAYSLN
jgi:hypothetical protein